jgi:hypothetical protein
MRIHVAAAALTLTWLVSGCALHRIEPPFPPPFRVDVGSAFWVGSGPASCAGAIAGAHSSLGLAGTAPADIAAAHASHALAMHEYHRCLAGVASP